MSAAPVFHLLGTSLTPRVNGTGGPSYGRRTAVSTLPSVTANAGSFGGYSIDLDDGTNYTQYGLSYNGVGNWPSTVEFSILLSVSFANLTASAHALFYCGAGGRPDDDSFGVWIDSTNITVRMINSLGQAGINSVTFAHGGLSNNTFYDISISFTGETTTNGCVVYLNGSSLGSTTSTRHWYDPTDIPPTPRLGIHRDLHFGLAGNNKANTRYKIREVAIWASIQDFTANFTTESGEATLNGASRTSPLLTTPSDGSGSGGGSARKTISLGSGGGIYLK